MLMRFYAIDVFVKTKDLMGKVKVIGCVMKRSPEYTV